MRYLLRGMLVFAPWVTIGLFGDPSVSPLVTSTAWSTCEGADAAMLVVGMYPSGCAGDVEGRRANTRQK